MGAAGLGMAVAGLRMGAAGLPHPDAFFCGLASEPARQYMCAVCLLGFTHMLRASTLGGGLKHNDHQEDPLDQGIQADMVITEPDGSTSAGISYTIQPPRPSRRT